MKKSMDSHRALLAMCLVAGWSAACKSNPGLGRRGPDASPASVSSVADATTPGTGKPDASLADGVGLGCSDKLQIYYAAVAAAQHCDPAVQVPCAEYHGVECPPVGVNPDAVASLSAKLAEHRAEGCELPLHSCLLLTMTPPPYVCRPGTDGVPRCLSLCDQMMGGRAACLSKSVACPNFVLPARYCGDTSVCCAIVCGDGLLAAGEECDDGNGMNGDGCSNACKCEDSSCGKRVGVCGDGVTNSDKGEECDDGNAKDGDGCGGTCKVEPCFWTACGCNQPCQPITVVCGDGVLGLGETCDDGNRDRGDGCSATCAVEPGSVCPVPGKPCQAI